MQRICCTVPNEDAVKVIGTLVKLGVDFSVENIIDANPVPTRQIQRKSLDGRTTAEIILDALTEKSPRTFGELNSLLMKAGFAFNTAGPVVSRLVRDEILFRTGDLVYCVESTKQVAE